MAIYNEDGIGGTFSNDCGVNPSGSCQAASDIDLGPIGLFGQATTFNIDNDMLVGDNSNQIWTKNFLSASCFGGDILYATYMKNGEMYRGKVNPCVDVEESNPRPFTKVNGDTNIYGDLDVIGNQSLCYQGYGSTCIDPGNGANNNSVYQKHINLDPDAAANGYVNSTSADLVLGEDDVVVEAWLYWIGRIYTNNDTERAKKSSANTVRLKTPDSNGYITINAEVNKFNWMIEGDYFDYGGAADVTEHVQNGGTYWVADLQATEMYNQGSGWALAVIIKDTTSQIRTMKNIALYDGFEGIYNESNEYPDSVSSTLDRFRTPKTGTVNANLIIFGGESDRSLDDTVTLTNKAGTPVALQDTLADTNNVLNGTVSKNGANVTTRNPNFANTLGVDIDYIDVSSVIGNDQSETTITVTSKDDRVFVSMYGFATDLYVPRLCYDYAYSQYDRFFTDVYDPLEGPILRGNVVSGEPVEIRISVRNTEESDFDATNVHFSVIDMDNTQISYQPETVSVTNPGDFAPTPVPDASFDVVGSSPNITDILGIPVGDIGSTEEFFVYYSVDTKTSSLDTPLDMKVDYSVTFPFPTGDVVVDFSSIIDQNMPICSGSNFVYTPEWSVFNIEERAISGTGKYNLYTQVAKRPFDFDLVAYDPENIHTMKGVNTIVALELIDAKPYHDVNASCQDPKSAITPRVWVIAGDGSLTPPAKTEVDIAEAIATGMTTASLDEFYGVARENTAFRISFNVVREGEDLVQWEHAPNGNFYITNFTDLVQDYHTCKQPVVMPNGNETSLVPVACQNAGQGNGITGQEMAICNECLYGYRTLSVCSRDNFSIRPEAFKVEIFDNAQSVNNGDPTTLVPNPGNIAAGYNYRYDLTAVSHSDENPVLGYTNTFVAAPDENRSLMYKWDPITAAIACNDTTAKYVYGHLVDGIALNQQNKSDNVGRYDLAMIDKAWTVVDQAPEHHTGSYYYLGNDCVVDSADVPSTGLSPYTDPVGCSISSTHTNVDLSKEYADYNITVHPFKFDLDLVSFYRGVQNTVVNNNSFVYMNTLTQDANMSARYDGFIKARGADDLDLSNFVADCYAQSIDLDVETSPLPATPIFRYRLFERDNVPVVIRDTNGTSGGLPELNVISVPATSFRGTTDGKADVTLHLNFDRFGNTPVNPIGITYGDLNVSCTTAANCQSYANMTAIHEPEGTKTVDATVIYLYGRVNAPRKRVMCASSTAACTGDMTFYYEFYADETLTAQEKAWITALLPSNKRQRSLDSVNWYRNAEHNISDGAVTATTQSAAIASGAFTTSRGETDSPFTYNAGSGFPYKDTVTVTSPTGVQQWLIYDPYNANPTQMSGEIEYYGPGAWTSGGSNETHTNITEGKKKINRRIRW
ncbi:hypothetical protein [Sulfurimonas sp. HSL3-7]|uniref:hypothetical protein n=1 Tax=Sulfonitrofixus jiaomeiensis TaxID=3131938 RepID=UPI0031F872A5